MTCFFCETSPAFICCASGCEMMHVTVIWLCLKHVSMMEAPRVCYCGRPLLEKLFWYPWGKKEWASQPMLKDKYIVTLQGEIRITGSNIQEVYDAIKAQQLSGIVIYRA